MRKQYLGESNVINLSLLLIFPLHSAPFYQPCRMNFNQVNTWHIHYKKALLEFYVVLKLDTNSTWELTLPLRDVHPLLWK